MNAPFIFFQLIFSFTISIFTNSHNNFISPPIFSQQVPMDNNKHSRIGNQKCFTFQQPPTDKLVLYLYPESLSATPHYFTPTFPPSFSFHQHQIGSSNKEIMKSSTGSIPPEKDFRKHVHNRGVNRTSLLAFF